jgi:hypothetical protein
VPPPLELQQPLPKEPPAPEPKSIELKIKSTTRPMISNSKVKNRVGKPLIGAKALVRTPALNHLPLIITTTGPTP